MELSTLLGCLSMKQEKPIKVSIITVCRDEAESIRETIESVLGQDCKDFEYIVIDGASTDGTAGIIRSYANRFSYWVSEPDHGIYEAMNKGIRRSKGEYLLFLNGGDILVSPNVLTKSFAVESGEDILYGDIYKADSGDRKLCSLAGYSASAFFMFTHTLPHQASFIKRKLFEDIGLYDESYRIMGDYEFFKRAIVGNRASIRYLGFPVCVFDLGGISTRAEYKVIQRIEANNARKAVYGKTRYTLYWIGWGLYDLFFYRPRRKLNKLFRRT
jgi:glycosyltransferase involved in cell wall biosynthesis